MSRSPLIQLLLPLGALALTACAEDRSPTQPESGAEPASAAPLAAALAPNTWTLMAAIPGSPALYGISAGVMPDASGQSIVYVTGGTDGGGSFATGILFYKIGTNTWSGKSPDQSVYVYNSNGIGRIGNTLYISGGESYAGGSWYIAGHFSAYNPATNTLTDKPTPPKLTADGVTGVIDGKLYVLPGRCSTDYYPNQAYCVSEPIRTLFRYSPTTNRWTWKRPAPHYHAFGAGGVINGKFYVAGGSNNYGAQLEASLDRYDPATDTWTTLAPLPAAGTARGAVLQGKLFVVVQTNTGRRAYAYDPATNKWTPKAAPHWYHDDIVPITWAGKPFLLAVGGIHFSPSYQPNPAEVYAP
jgi:N-acetylneuraminic acid mutarotase